MTSVDVPIDELLATLGFGAPEARRLARQVLEERGLTNPRKTRIATSKAGDVRAALEERLIPACVRDVCRADAARTGLVVVDAAAPTDCAICHGSANRAELDRAIAEMLRSGTRRLVVVGGSPGTREDLLRLIDGRIELRLVSGTDRRTARDAKADLTWANLIIIWGSTELDHKVSNLYTTTPTTPVVICPRRGISALASTLLDAAKR